MTTRTYSWSKTQIKILIKRPLNIENCQIIIHFKTFLFNLMVNEHFE